MKNGMITQENFAKSMQTVAEPYLAARRSEGYLKTFDGQKLYYAVYRADAPRGSVTIVHGFTENAEKYRELIYYFLLDGLCVLVYDARGHGRSYREVADTTLTHVARFSDYVEDLRCVTAFAADLDLPSPRYLYAHSMGGAVCALFLERGDTAYRKAVLSSPMIAPERGGFPLWVSKAVCRAAMMFGGSKKRIFISPPYKGYEEFDDCPCTCRERFVYHEACKRGCELFHNASPTYRWTLESLKVTARILQKGAVEKIAVPVRVYAAASDHTVRLPEQKAFAARLSQGEYRMVENTDHEICLATDDVALPYFKSLLEYFR